MWIKIWGLGFYVLMVSYETYCGIRKFLSDPVATTSFSAEVKLPRETLY